MESIPSVWYDGWGWCDSLADADLERERERETERERESQRETESEKVRERGRARRAGGEGEGEHSFGDPRRDISVVVLKGDLRTSSPGCQWSDYAGVYQ